jgi:hypothetical protein
LLLLLLCSCCFLLQLILCLDQVRGVDGFTSSQTTQCLIDIHVLGQHLWTQGLGSSGDELDELVAVVATADGL